MVGELSSFEINMKVGLTIEKNSYLLITFPASMPVDKGLTEVKLTGFASSTVNPSDN